VKQDFERTAAGGTPRSALASSARWSSDAQNLRPIDEQPKSYPSVPALSTGIN